MAESDKKGAASRLKRKPGGTERDSANQELQAGKVYTGTVTAVDPYAGTCTVLTKVPGKDIQHVVWATGGIMTPLLGFKTRQIPPLGARVVVMYGSTSFVIQILPSEPTDSRLGNKKSASGESYRSDKEVYGNGIIGGPVVDADALEGEFDISNAMNVGLLFLNNMMALKAGDRAKIETHLLNDMVRIISEVYRHHSAFGDFEIYNDGRLNVEWHGTSYEHESYNKDSPKAQKVPTKNHEVDLQNVEEQALFKQRFSAYIGHLGDFVQLFIREPQQTSTSIITGKAKFQIQNSGAVLMQSTDEIIFERVNRVVVPRRLLDPEDPDGNTYQELNEPAGLPQEPLVEWDFGPGNKNIHHVAHQLREYARYVSYSKSLARFKQLEKDFEVPSEAETPAPSSNNQEQDRAAVNGAAPFYETYSTIRMLRGGGIVLLAGDGSSLNLGNQQAVLSSVNRIVLDAAGDIVMNAGGSIYNTAYKDIHLTSVTGGIMQKARKKFHILCERGLLWLKSDGSPENTEGHGQGVYLDAAEGDVVINARQEMCVRSEEKDVTLKSVNGAIISKARTDIIQLATKGIHFTQALGGVLVQTKLFQFLARKILVNENIHISATTVDLGTKVNIRNRLKVQGNIYGPEVFKLVKYKHNGHIRVLRSELPVPDPQDGLEDSISELLASAEEGEKTMAELDGTTWKYDDREFPVQRPDGTSSSQYKPISQDFIQTHPDLFDESHDEWDFEDNKLKPATRTEPTLPYPGERSKQEMVHPESAGHVLDVPTADKEWTQTDLTPQPILKKKIK
jgi:uncharacterized protein (DUF2345 family)